MSRDTRKQTISALEAKRKSKVITYITSDRPNLSSQVAEDIIPIIYEHILLIKPEERKNIDLFIYSRGGDSDTPWSLVSMFRESSSNGKFNVIIPFKAHSAATMIALGADEIIMTDKGELGPIDITIGNGPYNPTEKNSNRRLPVSVEDVSGYFSLLKEIGCKHSIEKIKGFEQITQQVHPLVLGTVHRLLNQTELVALRLLNTRQDALSKRANKKIMQRLSAEIFSHRHTIYRSEAKDQVGIEFIKKAEDYKIEKESWELYKEYESLFSLTEPFAADQHLESSNLDEHTWNDLPMACVESQNQFNICKKSVRVRRLRKIPPNVTLNLSNISFPALPALPQGINAAQLQNLIAQMVQAIVPNVLNTAAQLAAQEFLRNLPSVGFETFNFNIRWEKEN